MNWFVLYKPFMLLIGSWYLQLFCIELSLPATVSYFQRSDIYLKFIIKAGLKVFLATKYFKMRQLSRDKFPYNFQPPTILRNGKYYAAKMRWDYAWLRESVNFRWPSRKSKVKFDWNQVKVDPKCPTSRKYAWSTPEKWRFLGLFRQFQYSKKK